MAAWDIHPDQPECTCADWGMMGCLSTCKQEIWRRKQMTNKETNELLKLQKEAAELGIRIDKRMRATIYTFVSAANLFEQINEISKRDNISFKDIHIDIDYSNHYDSPELTASYNINQTAEELKESIKKHKELLLRQKNAEYNTFLQLQKKFSLTPMES